MIYSAKPHRSFFSEFMDTMKLITAFFLWLLHDLFMFLRKPFVNAFLKLRRMCQNPD